MSETNKKPRESFLKHWQIISIYLIIYDVIAVNAAYFLALLLRFDFKYSYIPSEYIMPYIKFIPIYTVFCLIIFYVMRLYKSIWKFASFNELNRIAVASLITVIFHAVAITVLFMRMPISYYIVGAGLQTFFTTLIRFSYRYVNLQRSRITAKPELPEKRVMVIGAGSAGQSVIRELQSTSELNSKVCCIIDDNNNKWGRFLFGVQVVGGRETIFENAKKYNIDQILFAIPTLPAKDRKEVINLCNDTGCEVKVLPGTYQLANGEVLLSQMKPVQVEDLLGREAIKVNLDEILSQLRDKTILVTGGGGSIGSELCRQIASHKPERLIIFDIYENNAYDIEQELKRKYPYLNLTVLIGSVRDSRRIDWVFETYKPDIVYHAAAHKHVPLMETSPNEAIKNNVVGTYKTACAALKNGTQRFVLISTDKAVNPTNIMGASKRLCEMVIQSMDAISKSGRYDLLPVLEAHVKSYETATATKETENAADLLCAATEEIVIESVKNSERKGCQYVAVRFGNVLGSNGSVIPLFKKQIEAGGPVTVTHPDIVRYFMTIPEAVSLVLQAGTYAWGGEIFVLDMGEPMKIDTLARNLIRLSGYEPDVDIKIEYTGLRPGEKLYEERLMEEEGLKKTENEMISIGKPIPFDTEKFLKQLEELAWASFDNDPDIVKKVAEVVTTFHPQSNK